MYMHVDAVAGNIAMNRIICSYPPTRECMVTGCYRMSHHEHRYLCVGYSAVHTEQLHSLFITDSLPLI